MIIHRVLSELKLIDARIEKQTDELVPTGIYQKGKLISRYITEAEFETVATSRFQSIMDLIARKSAIKSAIVQSNGYTRVTVAGIEMTVADAINQKSAVKFKTALIEKLKSSHRASLAAMNKENAVVDQNVQRILEATFGKENVSVSAKDMDAVRVPYIDANEFHMFDPLNVAKTVEAMEKEVAEFEAEVDAVLSESNAVTFIAV